MRDAPLTADELIALIFLAVIAGAAVLYGVQKVVFAVLRRGTTVSHSEPAAQPHYVKAAPGAPQNSPVSVPSRREAEAEARREVRPEGEIGIVSLTEKALQSRDAENYQRGMIDAYATLLRLGHLSGGKGKMQKALAEVAGQRVPLLPGLSGRQLQALNVAIAEVPVPAEEEAPDVTPVAGREVPAGVKFGE